MFDPVQNPAHYAAGHPVFPGECIDYTRHMGFDPGNAFKYLWRWNRKEIPFQDLNKSLWYLDDTLAHSENIPTGSALEVRTIPLDKIEMLHAALVEYSSRPTGMRGVSEEMAEFEEAVASIQVAIARGHFGAARSALAEFISAYRAYLDGED